MYAILVYLAGLVAGYALIGLAALGVEFPSVGIIEFFAQVGVVAVIVFAILLIILGVKALLNKKHC
ncbi:hypothetical protein [Bacillus sp. AK031]